MSSKKEEDKPKKDGQVSNAGNYLVAFTIRANYY